MDEKTIQKTLTINVMMCSCTLGFRPLFLATIKGLNNCGFCGGEGWLPAHKFDGAGGEFCIECGWVKDAHA